MHSTGLSPICKEDRAMIRALHKFWSRSDDGASAVEYGLLVAGIAVVIIGVVFVLGNTIQDRFTETNTCITTNGVNCPAP